MQQLVDSSGVGSVTARALQAGYWGVRWVRPLLLRPWGLPVFYALRSSFSWHSEEHRRQANPKVSVRVAGLAILLNTQLVVPWQWLILHQKSPQAATWGGFHVSTTTYPQVCLPLSKTALQIQLSSINVVIQVNQEVHDKRMSLVGFRLLWTSPGLQLLLTL